MKKPPIAPEDSELFRSAMKDVRVLKPTDKLVPSPKPLKRLRQTVENEEEKIELEDRASAVFGAEDVLFFARPGLQHKVIKNLKSGHLAIDASLDLHGLTSEQAKLALEDFLDSCLKRSLKNLHIIHGKGERTPGSTPVLKNKIYHWLSLCPYVLAFSSCPPKLGGTGAVTVLIGRRRTTP